MQFLWKVFVTSLVFLFIGCGGGGSSSQTNLTETTDSSLVYEGKTTPMTFDQETSKKVISSSVNSSALNQVISTNTTSNKTSHVFAKQSKVSNGSVSGNVDFNLTEIDTVTHKLVATFDNYNDGTSETMTGGVVYTIVYEDSQRTTIKQMNMDIDLLTLKSSENSIILDGLLVAYVDNSTGNIRYVYNTVSKDNNTNEMSKFENFEVLLDAEDRPLSYKGKIYYSQEGYVLVSTPIELSYSDLTNTPDVGGEVHFEGDDAIVKERIAYDGRVRVEIDNDKDGTVDEFEVYTASTMEVVPNSAPVVTVSFPKEVFTDTNLSEVVNVNIYDPDLDEFTTSYAWQINNEVKSSSLVLSTELFKKNDNLKLIIEAEDNRVGEKKKTTESKTQTVLNSRPVITASFETLNLEVGQTKELAYSVYDADNDNITLSWDYVTRYDSESLLEYLNSDITSCLLAIQEHDTENSTEYKDLTLYEQEDFNRSNCTQNYYELDKGSYSFVVDKTYTAGLVGYFAHELTVDDGDYNRSKKFGSIVTQMDLIESQEYNHEAYTNNEVYPIYMKDMNNDNHQDLVYITLINREETIEGITEPNGNALPAYTSTTSVPVLNIEYREGKTILSKETYELEDFENYYVADLDGDAKLDILFTYNNVNDTSDNTAYGRMLQGNDKTLASVEKFTLDNRQSVVVEDIRGNSQEEIIIMKAENYESSNEVKIIGVEANMTISTSLPTTVNHSIMQTKLLVNDLDSNGKKDIIVVNKTEQVDSSLSFSCSVLSQELNGTFSEKVYEIVLQDGLTVSDFERVFDVHIVTLNGQENIWIVQSSAHLYLLKLEDNVLNIVKTLESTLEYPAAVDIVDINHDTKDDIVLRLNDSNSIPLHILIQKDDFEFLVPQQYNFTTNLNSFDAERQSVLGDIDQDGKYELFVSTSEENLSLLYFK